MVKSRTFSGLLPRNRFLLATVVPSLVVLLYLTFFAQPTYETETKMIIRENRGDSGGAIPGLASTLLGAGSRISLEDALILQDYLHSAAFIDLAAERFDLREHFHDAPSDPLRRLGAEAPSETFHKFMRRMITIRIVPESSIISVQVRAFSPQLAQELARFIIEQSEEMINDLNERMVVSQTVLAKRELERSMERVSEAKDQLLRFRITNAMVDPAGEVSAFFGNVAALDSRLVERKTDLRTKSQYLREDAFELRQLRQEIRALEEQREEETRLLVTAGDESLATTLQAYEGLKLQEEFALAAYSAAFAMAEKATMEASRQEKFLLVIAPPHPPEKPVFPEPLRGTVTVFLLCCIGYGILRLVLATIRDHTI